MGKIVTEYTVVPGKTYNGTDMANWSSYGTRTVIGNDLECTNLTLSALQTLLGGEVSQLYALTNNSIIQNRWSRYGHWKTSVDNVGQSLSRVFSPAAFNMGAFAGYNPNADEPQIIPTNVTDGEHKIVSKFCDSAAPEFTVNFDVNIGQLNYPDLFSDGYVKIIIIDYEGGSTEYGTLTIPFSDFIKDINGYKVIGKSFTFTLPAGAINTQYYAKFKLTFYDEAIATDYLYEITTAAFQFWLTLDEQEPIATVSGDATNIGTVYYDSADVNCNGYVDIQHVTIEKVVPTCDIYGRREDENGISDLSWELIDYDEAIPTWPASTPIFNIVYTIPIANRPTLEYKYYHVKIVENGDTP